MVDVIENQFNLFSSAISKDASHICISIPISEGSQGRSSLIPVLEGAKTGSVHIPMAGIVLIFK